MSVIRKCSFIIIAVITITCIVFIAGCGISVFGSTSSNTSITGKDKENNGVTKVEGGKIYETKKFSILWADMWDVIDVPDGTMIYNSDYSVLVTAVGNNVTEPEAKAFLEDIAKQNNGTAVEEISLLGVKFYKTSFTTEEKDQIMYSGILDGQQVIIKVTGKDSQNNKTIKAIIESIKLT